MATSAPRRSQLEASADTSRAASRTAWCRSPVRLQAATTSAYRVGLNIKTPAPGQYDVRVRRVTPDAETDLADKCSVPFSPAEFHPDTGERTKPASARCCTSDITLAEFKTLCGKMDASDPNAITVKEYLGGTANYRTDLYATCGTVLSHAESIELFKSLGAKMTPELKGVDQTDGEPTLPNDGFGDSGLNQQTYAQKMIDEYKAARVSPRKVWAQSFNLDDVLYWIANERRFGKQAVFLDGRNPVDLSANPPPVSEFKDLKSAGVNIVAPPMPALLRTNATNDIVPSGYGVNAQEAGLDIISWTTERSGRIVEEVIQGGGSNFYYRTTVGALENDGDILRTIDVLAQEVGIIGLFSDWPATTTFYANCALDDDDDNRWPRNNRWRDGDDD